MEPELNLLSTVPLSALPTSPVPTSVPSVRRVATVLIVLSVIVTLVSSMLGPVAVAAAQDAEPSAGFVPVLQVNGLVDPIVADFLEKAIARANDPASDSRAIVLLVNSRGSVLDDEALNDLAAAIDDSRLPVAAWVGPSGARALGPVAQLVGLAERVGVAPGARLGDTGEQRLDPGRFGNLWGDNAERLRSDTIDFEEARELGIAEFDAPIIGEFLVGLTDLGIEVSAVGEGTRLNTIPRFEGLSIFYDWMHTVASPPVAYLLFVIGLALFVFEYFTAGVGVAGLLGVGCFLLGCYGLGVLPTRWWAVALLVVSMLAFSVDVQTNVPRFWTVMGMIMFVVGTLWLFRDGVSMSWITIGVGIIGMALTFIVGMPTMVRTRFSTPTIGREWMVGELGSAVDAVAPDGVVKVRDALWKARTNRATPIATGDSIRVVAIEGLVLEVEPEEGGAKDYRDRRGSDSDSDVAESEETQS